MNNTVSSAGDGLALALQNVLLFTPKLIAFLVILFVGYFIAKSIGKVLDKVLRRVGFDGIVERGSLKKALGTTTIHASDILGTVVFYTAFLFVLQLAFGVFGPNPISDLLTRVIAFLPNIFVAMCIVVVASLIAAGVKEIVQVSIGGLSYGKMLATAAAAAILIVGGFAALDQLQIAPQIINGLFYAALAILVGVSVIGVGGGLVVPMQKRWETALNRVEQEAPRVQEHLNLVSPRAGIAEPKGYVA